MLDVSCVNSLLGNGAWHCFQDSWCFIYSLVFDMNVAPGLQVDLGVLRFALSFSVCSWPIMVQRIAKA